MEKLTFAKYELSQVLRIRKLSTAHYFTRITNYSTPPHQHEAWEFIFCASGQVHAAQGAETYVLRANQIVLQRPNTDHFLQVGIDPTTMFILSFVCDSGYLRLLQNQILRVTPSQKRVLLLIIQELGNAFDLENGQLQLGDFHPSCNPVLGSEQMIAGYMENFLITLLRSVTHQQEKKWDSDALQHALDNRLSHDIQEYVEAHLPERITLDDLTRHVHYSRSYITSQFQNAMGTSISKYVSERRIEKAKELLQKREITVSQISEVLGFSSLQYFSKCFKDAVGCSPSAYQKGLQL